MSRLDASRRQISAACDSGGKNAFITGIGRGGAARRGISAKLGKSPTPRSPVCRIVGEGERLLEPDGVGGCIGGAGKHRPLDLIEPSFVIKHSYRRIAAVRRRDAQLTAVDAAY